MKTVPPSSTDSPADTPHAELEQRAQTLLRERFLAEAATEAGQQHIARDLDAKRERVAQLRSSDKTSRLHKLIDQASTLWAERGQLNRQQIVYLSAALLYFISPLDALPDVVPGLGYVDDVAVLSAIITMVMKGISRARLQIEERKQEVIEEVTDKLVAKGQAALHEVIDQRADELFARFDKASADAVDQSVTTLVVSLWGMTTAAAVSLALSILFGGLSSTWMVYVGVTTALVLAWNIGVAIDYLRSYRRLSGKWQQRLRMTIAARLAWRHGVAIGIPVLMLLALAGLRLAL